MYFVYILKGKYAKTYIGFTANIEARVRAHNSGSSKFTRKYCPWEVVYYEAFKSENDARKREKTLKNYGSSLGQLKKRASESLL